MSITHEYNSNIYLFLPDVAKTGGKLSFNDIINGLEDIVELEVTSDYLEDLEDRLDRIVHDLIIRKLSSLWFFSSGRQSASVANVSIDWTPVVLDKILKPLRNNLNNKFGLVRALRPFEYEIDLSTFVGNITISTNEQLNHHYDGAGYLVFDYTFSFKLITPPSIIDLLI